MPDLIQQKVGVLMHGFSYWKLAIFKVSGKALVALALSIVTTLNGSEWSEFSPTQKFVACVTALATMWMVVEAFLNTTMSDIAEAQEEEEAKLPNA